MLDNHEIIGPNFLEPLSGSWFKRTSNSTITYQNNIGMVFNATGTTGWSCYIFSQNNIYTLNDLYDKTILLEYDVADISLTNNSSISFGLAAFSVSSPTQAGSRYGYTSAADNPTLLAPTTNGHYEGRLIINETTIVPHDSRYSLSNYVGATVYLNGYNGDHFTITNFQLHIIN